MLYRQKTKKALKNFKMAKKNKINMREQIRGIIFCFFWYFSVCAGFFLLLCPILPLAVISPKKYRRWSDRVFGMWEPFTVAMMEVLFGIRVVLSGDKINPFEGSLFIMNHRTRVDWTFLWMGLFHCCQPNAHNIKYVLKAPIMHIPGPGWVMQTCSFIFVHRNWEKDKVLLNNLVDYLNDSDQLYQILIFPEGTDLSDNNIQKSHKFADSRNLERYYKVLHPRTNGFAFLAHKMKSGGQLKAVYDVTIAYPKTMPLTEGDLLRGKFPEEVHFDVKRYSSVKIPFDENELKEWLKDVWRHKEKKLQQFYTVGYFSESKEDRTSKSDYGNSIARNALEDSPPEEYIQNNVSQESLSPTTTNKAIEVKNKASYIKDHTNCDNIYTAPYYRPSHLLILVLAFWMTLTLFIFYGLFYNVYVQIWVLTHSLFFGVLSLVSNGFHHIAASIYFYRYERKPSIIKKSE